MVAQRLLLMPCLFVSLALAQTERATPPPAKPPPAANADDGVLRALDAAQLELRWLLDRNAGLERALAEERQENARKAAALGEQAEAQRLRATQELQQLRASFERQRAAMRAEAEAVRAQAAQERERLMASSQDAAAVLRREVTALEAAHRRDTNGLRDEKRALTAQLDTARQPPAPVAREAAASPRATESDTRERPARRCTPTRSTVLLPGRGVPQLAAPAEPDQPAPGTRTPRRRGKID